MFCSNMIQREKDQLVLLITMVKAREKKSVAIGIH